MVEIGLFTWHHGRISVRKVLSNLIFVIVFVFFAPGNSRGSRIASPLSKLINTAFDLVDSGTNTSPTVFEAFGLDSSGGITSFCLFASLFTSIFDDLILDRSRFGRARLPSYLGLVGDDSFRYLAAQDLDHDRFRNP